MFGRKKATGAGDGATASLRELILRTPPDELGFAPGERTQVYGMLMETGYDSAVATIVSLADGTTSMYFSSGGGTIGAGDHESVADATRAFVAAAGDFASYALPTADFPSPGIGEVRFQFLTFGGGLTASASEDDLGNQRHALSPLFFAGQDVITQIRLVQESAGG
ncbi:MAG: hypothetical protein JWR83_1823 [Aeromicrobium sp.]|nr:hypothetical protein [Aeromicrobium sp.]